MVGARDIPWDLVRFLPCVDKFGPLIQFRHPKQAIKLESFAELAVVAYLHVRFQMQVCSIFQRNTLGFVFPSDVD